MRSPHPTCLSVRVHTQLCFPCLHVHAMSHYCNGQFLMVQTLHHVTFRLSLVFADNECHIFAYTASEACMQLIYIPASPWLIALTCRGTDDTIMPDKKPYSFKHTSTNLLQLCSIALQSHSSCHMLEGHCTLDAKLIVISCYCCYYHCHIPFSHHFYCHVAAGGCLVSQLCPLFFNLLGCFFYQSHPSETTSQAYCMSVLYRLICNLFACSSKDKSGGWL